MGNEWQSLLVTENILFPSTETGHHPTTPVEAEHPPTVRFSLQKENVLLHSSSRSVSCCAWLKKSLGLKLHSTEYHTDKLLVQLNDSADLAQQNTAPL